jgi:hypothetical protein
VYFAVMIPRRQNSLQKFCLCALFLVGCVVFSVHPATLTNNFPAESRPVFTNAAQILALSPEEARRNYPVRLRGVVVYCSQKVPGNFVLQDSTADIFVFGAESHLQTVRRGQIVELEGVTKLVATASPDVHLMRLQVTGETGLPAPRAVTYAQMASGNEDAQWVEVRGIVRSVSKVKFPPPEPLAIELSMGGNRLIVRVERYDLAKLQTMIDAEVRMRGLCFYFFNQKRQIFNFRVSVQEMEDIVIEKPAPDNPYGDPLRPVSQLLVSTPGGKSEHRVHVQGEVTSPPVDGSFYLQDDTQGVRVFTSETTGHLNLNDRVEVVGFAETGEYSPVVRDAIFRRLGPGQPLSPASVSPEAAPFHDSGLVRLQARLLERMHLHDDILLVLETTHTIFNAHLRTTDVNDQRKPGGSNRYLCRHGGGCIGLSSEPRGQTIRGVSPFTAVAGGCRCPPAIVMVDSPERAMASGRRECRLPGGNYLDRRA